MSEDKKINGYLYGVPVTATIKGKPDYTPTTEEGAEIMNDYTPTTGEIRLLMQSSNIAFEVPPEGFDRWLAEVKADAWEEGLYAGAADSYFGYPDNPYRQVGDL